jgi:hypothetical protein
MHLMSNHQNKPGGKSGQRARKADQPRSQKPDQESSLMSPQAPNGQGPIDAALASPPAVTSPVALVSPAVPASPDAFAARATAPANTPSVDFQAIAMAYGDYTKKSFEQTRSFAEKLAGVRSLDKAIEIQIEFARQAYETFVSESQKICELYSGLARQGFEGVIAKVIPATR